MAGKFALLIGVGEYGHPTDFPGLPAAARNAAALGKVLRDEEKGNFQAAAPEDHSRVGVGEAMERLFSGRNRSDVLLLYFSGYVIEDHSGRFHLATRDTCRDGNGELLSDSAIPVSLLRDAMRDSRAKSCIAILDICSPNVFPKGPEAEAKTKADNDGLLDIRGQFDDRLGNQFGNRTGIVLSAYSPDPAAFGQGETPSPYTGALVEGMENWEADLNRVGRICLDEWHEFAREKIHGRPDIRCHARYPNRKGRRIRVAEMPAGVFRERYAEEAGKFVDRQGRISSIGREELKSWRRGRVLAKREFGAIEEEACEPCRVRFRGKCEKHAWFIWEKMGENAGKPPSREAVLASRRSHDLMKKEAEEIERKVAGIYRHYGRLLKKYGKFYARTIRQVPLPPETQNRLQRYWEELGLAHGKLEMFGMEIDISVHQDEERARVEEQAGRKELLGRKDKAGPQRPRGWVSNGISNIHRLSIQREHVALFFICVVILVFGWVLSIVSGLNTVAPDFPDRLPWNAERNRETTEIAAPSAEPEPAELVEPAKPAIDANVPNAAEIVAVGPVPVPVEQHTPQVAPPGLEPDPEPEPDPSPEPDEGEIAPAPVETDGPEETARPEETDIPGAIAIDNPPVASVPEPLEPGPLEPGPDEQHETQPEKEGGEPKDEAALEEITPEPEEKAPSQGTPAPAPVPALAPDYGKWRVLSKIQAHAGAVCRSSCIAFSPDGRAVLSGGHDGAVKLWDVETGELKPGRAFEGSSGRIYSVAFAPDGRGVLSGGYDTTLKRWDVAGDKGPEIFRGHAYGVASVAFSPDGGMILSGSWDDTVKLWDAASGGAKVKTLRAADSRDANAVAFSPDGRAILSGSADGQLRLWHMDEVDDIPWNEGSVLEPYRTFMGHTLPVLSVAFSPDGKTALSGSRGRIFKLWDVDSGKKIHTFWGHSAAVRSVAFSPDGKTVLSGSDDRTLKLWDVESGQVKRTLNGHAHQVHSVAFAPDGLRAASGDKSGVIILWGPEATWQFGMGNGINIR